MSLIVCKFGGTSVASPERIQMVAKKLIAKKQAGHQVVAVVSAMGKTTDELVGLAASLNDNPPAREMDRLLSTGEQVSMTLLAMAIEARGYKAMSDTEKVNVGFTRRMKKTRRNANRMSRVVGSVNRNALSADDARAHDQNMAKAGLLEGLLHQLPRGVTSLRVTVDISRDMPGLMP